MTSPSLGTLDEHVLELNVHDYARALWRHRVRIALVVLVFGGTAAAATLARPPEYHAAATMTVIHDEGQPPPPIASYQDRERRVERESIDLGGRRIYKKTQE